MENHIGPCANICLITDIRNYFEYLANLELDTEFLYIAITAMF